MRRPVLTYLLLVASGSGGGWSASPLLRQHPVVQQSPQKEAEAREALEQRVSERMAQCLTLVIDAEQIVKNSPRASSRAFGHIMLGEALWEHDKERARGHLRNAFEAVSQVPLNESWPERDEVIPLRNPFHLFPLIIKRIAKLDPDLAYDLTRQFGQRKDDGTVAFREEEGTFNRNEAMLYAASALVETDRQRGVSIASEVSQRYAGFQLVLMLFKIQKADRSQADKLALAALEALRRRTPSNLEEFYILGSYVFPQLPFPFRVENNEARKLPINPTLAAGFLSAYLSAVQRLLQTPPQPVDWAGYWDQQSRLDKSVDRMSPAERAWRQKGYESLPYNHAYRVLSEIGPYVSEYAPALGSLHESLRAQVATKLSDHERRANEELQQYKKELSSGSLDELLGQAHQESSPSRRDQILAGAIDVAVKTKQFDRVESILTQISRLEIRQNMTELYHFRAVEHYLSSGEAAEARRHATALKKPELLVMALVKVAESVEQKEASEARSNLVEAERLLASLPDSAEKARASLRLAAAYARLDPASASSFTRVALIQMGKTDAQLDDLSGVTIQWLAIKGATRETGTQGFGAGDLTPLLMDLMGRLAVADFEGALITLAQVARGEVKLMAEPVVVRQGFEWIKQARSQLEPPNTSSTRPPSEPKPR